MKHPHLGQPESLADIDAEVLQLVLDQLPIGLAVYGPDRRLKLWNVLALRILNLPADLIVYDMPFAHVARYVAERGGYGAGDPQALAAARADFAFSQAYHRTEFRDESGGAWESVGRRLDDGSLIFTYADVSERRAREQWVKDLVYHDQLTGRANRRGFFRALEAQPGRGGAFAVAIADLDRFKSVNDSHGHAAGDALLAAVAERMAQRLEEGDMLARLGGDEFGLLLVARRSPRDLILLLDGLRQACAEPFALSPFALSRGEVVRIAVSIGLAHHPADGDTVGKLLRQADTRMYADKQRNRRAAP